jgi:dTDP-4-dehydrorhamnose reductase
MRIFVTGAGGGLARAFLGTVPAHHDVEAFTHAELDIGDHDAVMQTVVPAHPDVVMNLAAFTKVDACENDQASAYRGNTLGPANLALAARSSDAMMLHVSTDYVFDGEKGEAYDELDVPNPRSVYARSKLGGEHLVRETLAESFVVRTGFVFGGGRDYLSSAVERVSQGERVGGLADRFGTPTWVRDLAERLLPLVLTQRFGTYHVAGPERISWYEVLKRVRTMTGFPGEVEPQRAEELDLPAPRPNDSSLTSIFTSELGIAPMPALDDSLKDFLDEH